jgi:hypothetical protein
MNMSKKITTKASKATKTTKAAAPAIQVKKDANGRFWLVPKDGSAEQGLYATKKEALDAKAAPAHGAPATKAGKAKAAAKTNASKDKKLSAIDAAAQVLASSKEPLNARRMMETMAAKNLWTSPGGKTPHATLYSREIAVKGKESRFVK